jgi:hypothetical protein
MAALALVAKTFKVKMKSSDESECSFSIKNERRVKEHVREARGATTREPTLIGMRFCHGATLYFPSGISQWHDRSEMGFRLP